MISAERTIDAPVERVFAFLAHLPNHWELHDALVHVEATGESAARVRVVGPIGLRREARTRVAEVDEPSRLRGVAELGPLTTARVAWDIEARGERTHVRLSTEVGRASRADRLILALGGTWWLRRVYAQALANLERALAA